MQRLKEPLAAYFHPTTACIIDDNESFMAGLALVLPENMNSIAFTDPVEALEYANQPHAMPTLAERCFSAARSTRRQLFRLNTDLIEQEINLPRRFDRLSVVIVDYSMPALNGLQFCERLNDPQIGKVLLTGVADEKMAVEAFNAGLIDRFISKSHPSAGDYIGEFSRDMQRAYFRAQTEQMRRSLSLAGPVFLDDANVSDWVRRLLARENFCEYYMVSRPPGLLLATPSGSLQHLIVLNDAQCSAQADYAQENHAPPEVVQSLRDRSHVGFFLEDPASYGHGEAYPWNELLHRSTLLGDSGHQWYVALVAEPPPHIDFQPEETCFNAQLNQLNQETPAALAASARGFSQWTWDNDTL